MTAGDLTRRTDMRVSGKFLEVAGARFLVKGVSYGTFAPDAAGIQFPDRSRIADDFAQMSASGFNTVRTYTVPPEPLLDLADRHRLKVMIGIPWSQHVAFLSDRAVVQQIRGEALDTIARFAAHPAALLFAIGNEIPPAVVRWHGEARITRFLRELYHDIKSAVPSSLLTYVNFPPTEFLDLDFLDVCSFNVYLHRQSDLKAYLARLQHIAGHKPLLLAEAGADSIREGLQGQGEITAMHVRTAFEEGACGAVAFAWTDEWWRGGDTVDDWAFGLVDRDRHPKPALAAVTRAFDDAPFTAEVRANWPRVSVVVCAYNAAETIDECLESLAALNYPDYEVIVVNDGSRDATGEIARRYPVRVLAVPNGGLSAARNLGWANATGDVVAYTDADVRVEPDWLQYLVQPIVNGSFAGSGGPNVVPPEDPWIAQCVARAPGGPTHVLLDDRVAEHVPGCNMAFRREALASVGGFNPTYLRAGDDVDVCWRLQAKGHQIGFAPAALVWHHHRSSVKAYWRQQVGYGEGETWLDAHHPEKFIGGQMLWRGRIYSPLPFIRSLSGRRVNTGVWGSAAFPSVYRTDPYSAQFLPHTPAWMLLSLAACICGVLLTPYPALGWVLLLSGLSGWAITFGRCVQFARRTDLASLPNPGVTARPSRFKYRAVIAWLHFIQPIARLYGRLRGMWSPPSPASSEHVSRLPWKAPFPVVRHITAAARLLMGGQTERQFWSEAWIETSTLLNELAGTLRASRPAPLVAIDDGWHADRDLSLEVGGWGHLQVRALIEEHAQGKCLFRAGARLRLNFGGAIKTLALVIILVGATSAAMVLRWPSVSEVTTALVAMLFGRAVWQAARTFALLDRGLIRSANALNLTPMGKSAMPWSTRFTWRPLTAAPVVQAASVLAIVLSAAFSVTSLVERIRAHVPFGTNAVVASLPMNGRTPSLAGSVAVGTTGDVVFADATQGTIRRLRVRLPLEPLRAADYLSVLANSSPSAVAAVVFRDASDVAFAPNGDIYVADAGNHRVCRIDRATGKITTIAGDGSAGFDGDGGQAAQAALDSPVALAVARSGDLYIADTGNDRIRMLSAATGVITTVAGGGSGGDGTSGDGGPALMATLNRPSGVAIAANGDLYISDTGHHVVRRLSSRTGKLTTIAGDGAEGIGDADGVAIRTHLSAPVGLALVPVGSATALYVADQGSNTIRLVRPDGTISTLATGKKFVRPSRLAYHPVGWLIVKDASADGLTAVRVPVRTSFELATRKRLLARKPA